MTSTAKTEVKSAAPLTRPVDKDAYRAHVITWRMHLQDRLFLKWWNSGRLD